MNKKLNEYLERALSCSEIHFIAAMQLKRIELIYGAKDFPVVIIYPEQYMLLNDKLATAAKKIELNL